MSERHYWYTPESIARKHLPGELPEGWISASTAYEESVSLLPSPEEDSFFWSDDFPANFKFLDCE